jgi:hypothetical protein
MWWKTKSYFCEDRKAKPEITHNISYKDRNVSVYKRSNRSLELIQTIIQRKQYPVDNYFHLVLTNIHVVEQMEEAIVGGLSNVWYRSNIANERYISYLTYD